MSASCLLLRFCQHPHQQLVHFFFSYIKWGPILKMLPLFSGSRTKYRLTLWRVSLALAILEAEAKKKKKSLWRVQGHPGQHIGLHLKIKFKKNYVLKYSMYVKRESTNSLQPCLTGLLIYHLHLCLSSPQRFPSQPTSSLCDLPPRDAAALWSSSCLCCPQL